MTEEKKIEELQKELEKERAKQRRRTILIIILIILILLLHCCLYLAGYRWGKIGYEETSASSVDIIQITQGQTPWRDIQDLDIFSNPEFENKKMIAPYSNSTYKFAIENVQDKPVIYNISMSEENEHNVNMKYKLKIDNIYIVGDENTWVEPEKLKLQNIVIMPKSKNIYTLEWYWEDSERDTQIGKLVYAEYKLKININSSYYTD